MLKFKTKYDTIGKTLYQSKSDKPSLTDESYKQECDIDFIISNFVQRGIEPPQHQIDYGKQYTSDDFANAMQTVAECKTAYECLPATEKEKFNNSVTNYLDFISDPKNLKESYEKGYINPDSVNIADVYPERFIKEDTTIATHTQDKGQSSTGEKAVVVPATAGSENPTSSNLE